MPVNRLYEVLAGTLKKGGVGVMPTDTIYGIVGSALNKKTVERIYRLRKRNTKKPMIVLVSSQSDLRLFGATTTPAIKKLLKKLWPGKVSVIMPCPSKKFSYLHRGSGTIAFRLPKAAMVRGILKITGPLVAPSANFEGKPAARTIKEAKRYFKDRVDFYADAGRLVSQPSTLVTIKNGSLIVLRKGAVKV
jgi:L-threonylcarbamoyladenylate synthase